MFFLNVMLKEIIRKEYLSKRLKLTDSDILNLSNKIIENVLKIDEVNKAKVIMGYYPIKNEVNILPLLKDMQKQGKIILLPDCDLEKRTLIPLKVNSFEELTIGKFNIPIPKNYQVVNLEEIEVIFIPALAFDMQCYRLGYGYKYYDNFLKKVNAIKIGLAYDFQIINKLPVDESDVKVDIIVTDKRIIFCNNCC